MVDVLTALGIQPDGMFGHSLGENVCAYADGCFTKYQAIMAAYYRGKASSEVSVRKGLMAAVGMRLMPRSCIYFIQQSNTDEITFFFEVLITRI